MSLNQPIKDLEKVESIPQGTAYVASMGNGSGVKAVTQEVLTQAVGEALKIGNTEELQTTNRGSLVDAINEAAQSGGSGAAVDILDSEEEIEANTEEGKVAGALALKGMFSALNDKLGNGQISFDIIDGEPYVKVGADTPRPFSNFKGEATILKNDANSSASSVTINNALQYKAIFASLSCKSTGAYTLECTGANKVCEWGINYDGFRHHNAVFFPEDDVVTITGWRSLYVCGVK